MRHPPGGPVGPRLERCGGPRSVLVGVANVAGIRDLQGIGLSRRHEMKRVAADIHIGDRLFDLRHVTGDAFAPGAARLVVRMRFDARGMRPVLRIGAVAAQADLLDGLAQDAVVFAAMRIVATETGDAARKIGRAHV